MTEGFSAKDISEIVTKAMMGPVRNVETATHFKWVCMHPCPFPTGTGNNAHVTKVKYTRALSCLSEQMWISLFAVASK